MATYLGRVGITAAFLVACVLAVGVAAQTPSDQKPVPKVKSVSAVPITSLDGRDNFTAYCAVCHGLDATGNGPAAPAMKVPVTDLTAIAKRNKNGKFDAVAVQLLIKGAGKTSTPAHGIETMPIWGDVFAGENPSTTTLRVHNLVKYLESIQQ